MQGHSGNPLSNRQQKHPKKPPQKTWTAHKITSLIYLLWNIRWLASDTTTLLWCCQGRLLLLKVILRNCVMFIFTFMHLADAFIQSDLQCIQALHLYCQYVCSLGIKPTTFALLMQCSNHWATGTLLLSLLEIRVVVFERLFLGCADTLFMFMNPYLSIICSVVSQLIRGDTLLDW